MFNYNVSANNNNVFNNNILFGFAAPKGFLLVKDSQDGYEFYHPFGWQEVTVTGQDVVYKDIIEPLESVSVSITTTDKADVTEFGPPEEVRPG
jgi:photosystem II oxygen-evolving enhancer protein 2